MLNQTVLLKLKQRINKLDSDDFDNLQTWMAVEAINKAQIEWVRRQLVGTNILKQGDEQSERRIDDLNILLRTVNLILTELPLYYQSTNLPFLTITNNTDPNQYMAFKRLEVYATSECCPDPRLMIIYLIEEANAINYLLDDNKGPSFEWGETLASLVGRKIRIYTNDKFQISSAALMYYRIPRKMIVAGSQDPYTGLTFPNDTLLEFKDDICELIIDEAASILAKDIENEQVAQSTGSAAEQNN